MRLAFYFYEMLWRHFECIFGSHSNLRRPADEQVRALPLPDKCWAISPTPRFKGWLTNARNPNKEPRFSVHATTAGFFYCATMLLSKTVKRIVAEKKPMKTRRCKDQHRCWLICYVPGIQLPGERRSKGIRGTRLSVVHQFMDPGMDF